MGNTPAFLTVGGGGPKPKQLSYIEDHEIEEAKVMVEKAFEEASGGKRFGYRVCGPFIVCKVYVRPEELKIITADDGTKTTLWLPPQYADNDKYHSVSALVMGVGPEAFSGNDEKGYPRFPNGPRCRIGDWINIPRQSSYLFQYRGVALAQIYDDLCLGVCEDPRDLTPINQKPLI